jgi:hypothetical protein
MSDDGWAGSARCVSAGALRHQEALVRDELRRLSRVWRTTPPRGAVRERTGSRGQSLGELGAAGGLLMQRGEGAPLAGNRNSGEADRRAGFGVGHLPDEAPMQDAPLALG